MSFRQIHNYMRNLTLIFCFYLPFCGLCKSFVGSNEGWQSGFYGNEWINHAQTYHKLKVGHDGLHKINHALLSQLGLLQGGSAERIAIFKNGKQIPLYLTSPNQLGDQDFILFYGEKNTIELDTFLLPIGNKNSSILSIPIFQTAALIISPTCPQDKQGCGTRCCRPTT